MAESHVNSGIANKISKLKQHKQSLLKQIQEIDQQISILTQAAKIMGEIDQLPKLRSQAFGNSVRALVVQVLKQATEPLTAAEITTQAMELDRETKETEQPTSKTDIKHLKSVQNALSFLIKDGIVSKTGSRKDGVKYFWDANQEKGSRTE